jgi:hypothetical protein
MVNKGLIASVERRIEDVSYSRAEGHAQYALGRIV